MGITLDIQLILISFLNCIKLYTTNLYLSPQMRETYEEILEM